MTFLCSCIIQIVISIFFFVLTRNLPLVFLCFLLVLFYVSCPLFSIMPRKTRANRTSTSSPSLTFDSERFLSQKNQEAFEKLNLRRNIWAERKVLLDELDPEIRRNFERRGWLPLLDISHPPPTTLIREFYLNLSVHSYDANTLVRSWVRGVGYTITPSVMADALRVPVVRDPIYPYDKSPPLVTSCLISLGLLSSGVLILGSLLLSSLRFIIFFFQDCLSFFLAYLSSAHHSFGALCILYALVTDAPISFPHLFICSLIEVHRSSFTAYALFFPVFIHRILLHLSLVEFPASEPIHIVAPIGAGLLRQRAAHLKASSKRPKAEPSGVAPPP